MADNQKELTPDQVFENVLKDFRSYTGYPSKYTYNEWVSSGEAIKFIALRFHSAMIEAMALSDEQIEDNLGYPHLMKECYSAIEVNEKLFQAVVNMRDHFIGKGK